MSKSSTGNSAAQVLTASLIGTTIEYFDFYIYSTAAVLVFPKLFFPSVDATAATLESLATFALAFFARPFGAALFGHFGDRIGRKATLVAALMTMGPSTVAIGLLPSYQSIGVAAPILLAVFRFGQGLGLGGEWGGAVLLATENAPPGKKALYGMFPQLGAPIGLLFSSGIFLILSMTLTDAQFVSWGWRIPFLASAILIVVGLYVRMKISETPAFQKVIEGRERVRIPMLTVFTRHTRALVLGTFAAITTFVIFYLISVFALSWGVSALGYAKGDLLKAQLIADIFFALGIPVSAIWADKFGRGNMLIIATVLILLFGFSFTTLFTPGNWGLTVFFFSLGLFLMGLTYGPLGTALSEIFPASVRYTGASLCFTVAGILGASVAPYIATTLAKSHGLDFVGYYLSAAATLTLTALLFIRKRMS
jgi:metabolite-proton symporter